MGRIESIKPHLDDVDVLLDEVDVLLKHDIDVENKLVKLIYLGMKANCGDATYHNLIDLLKCGGLSDNDIKELDFAFLRNDYIQNHSYDVADIDFNMYNEYRLNLSKVQRIRGLCKCKICNKPTVHIDITTDYPVCSKICQEVLYEGVCENK